MYKMGILAVAKISNTYYLFSGVFDSPDIGGGGGGG